MKMDDDWGYPYFRKPPYANRMYIGIFGNPEFDTFQYRFWNGQLQEATHKTDLKNEKLIKTKLVFMGYNMIECAYLVGYN